MLIGNQPQHQRQPRHKKPGFFNFSLPAARTEGPLFLSPSGKSWSVSGLGAAFRRIRTRALQDAAAIADAVAEDCCDRRDKARIVAEAIRERILHERGEAADDPHGATQKLV